ncbi:putative Xre family DNA-binding protein [Oscillibacter valericigenes Sjm18-20]|nr:putative Xre family DNA-binding protein [Oscillibacter valericigenes Sjm18-20]
MEQIGERLRQLRKSKNITLEQLGKEAGLSAGFISLVENGKSNIALDTLSKILLALGSGLDQFFDKCTDEIDDPVVHSVELTWTLITENIAFSVLSSNVHNFELYPRFFLMHPEAEPTQTEMLQHDGEEFIMVLEGVATIYYAGRSYLLYPGDSIQIHSNLPHNWANKTNHDVKILSVHSPNPFPKEGTAIDTSEIVHQVRKRKKSASDSED